VTSNLTRRLGAFALFTVLVLSACGPAQSSSPSPGGGATEPPLPGGSLGPRPSSPATLTITAPNDGATVTGTSVHIAMDLENATITSATTTNITPTEGHIHLYVDNVIRSMNYSTEQDLPVTPGTYVLKAEFVAADHAPYSPRVWSNQVIFTVQ
jgi:hypothetical protein